MRSFPILLVCALLLPISGLLAQIPAQEDIETKSHWEAYQSGLEIREVRESAARDVGEALARTPGMAKVRKAGIANDIVLRGFSGDNLTVLIDGMRVYGACPGHMDPEAFHVDFAEVERIDITKGAFDVTNQGSMGGSINVVRKRALPGFHFAPSFQVGSFGYLGPSLTASAGGDRFQVSGGYSMRRSDAFRSGNGDRITSLANYRPEAVDGRAFGVQTGWASVRFSPAEHQSGELSYARQDARGVLYPYLQMDAPYDIADRIAARYEWRELPGMIERFQLSSYYTTVNHWMTDEKRLSSVNARDVFSMATFARTRVGGGRADLSLRHGFDAGVEIYQRNWDAVNSMRSMMMVTDQHIVPNVNTTLVGAFVDWNKSITDRLRVGAGLRLDTANMNVRASNPNDALWLAYKGTTATERRNTNPSANARITYGFHRNAEIFLGVGSNLRLPDPQERFFGQRRMGTDWLGNPALRPTRNTETNAGITFRKRNFYVRPVLFYSSLSDFIVVHNQARRQMVPGVMNTMARSYDNVDATMVGGELSYGLSLGTRWVVHGGSAYSRGSKRAIPALGIFNTNLPEIPPLRAQSAVRYGTRLWFAEVEGIAASAQKRIDTDLSETATAGYGVMNLKCGWHREGIAITAGLENVLDRQYREHLSFQRDPFRSGVRVPEPGRTLFLNIGYSF
jgi:iron complex outermembrane receptor protein